jgi:hypothetical protein
VQPCQSAAAGCIIPHQHSMPVVTLHAPWRLQVPASAWKVVSCGQAVANGAYNGGLPSDLCAYMAAQVRHKVHRQLAAAGSCVEAV